MGNWVHQLFSTSVLNTYTSVSFSPQYLIWSHLSVPQKFFYSKLKSSCSFSLFLNCFITTGKKYLAVICKILSSYSRVLKTTLFLSILNIFQRQLVFKINSFPLQGKVNGHHCDVPLSLMNRDKTKHSITQLILTAREQRDSALTLIL